MKCNDLLVWLCKCLVNVSLFFEFIIRHWIRHVRQLTHNVTPFATKIPKARYSTSSTVFQTCLGWIACEYSWDRLMRVEQLSSCSRSWLRPMNPHVEPLGLMELKLRGNQQNLVTVTSNKSGIQSVFLCHVQQRETSGIWPCKRSQRWA